MIEEINYIHNVTAHLCHCLSTDTRPGVTLLHSARTPRRVSSRVSTPPPRTTTHPCVSESAGRNFREGCCSAGSLPTAWSPPSELHSRRWVWDKVGVTR